MFKLVKQVKFSGFKVFFGTNQLVRPEDKLADDLNQINYPKKKLNHPIIVVCAFEMAKLVWFSGFKVVLATYELAKLEDKLVDPLHQVKYL